MRYNKYDNKAVLFFSSSSTDHLRQLYEAGIREVLVSYFYIKKNIPFYEAMFEKIYAEGGIIMVDSGAFSFMAGRKDDNGKELTEEFWEPYLKEYVDFIKSHRKLIFCAANLDLDKMVGHEVVHRWNRDYFEPLEKEGLSVVYVAHEEMGDPHAIRHFRYYASKYDYVGINQTHKKYASRFYQIANEFEVRVHGFAWTELPILKNFPFFSADSISWLSGEIYGLTYDYDGKNFKQFDKTKKYVRKSRYLKYKEIGVEFDKSVSKKQDREFINRVNLEAWFGFRDEYLKRANLKLITNKAGYYYDERRKAETSIEHKA